MKIKLLHSSPLYLAAHGARTCWDSHDKSDTPKAVEKYITDSILEDGYCASSAHIIGEKDAELVDRVGNKFRHASILEHLVYSFYIEGISRACLQELSRHRMASPSVKSTRYTISELKKELPIISTKPEGSKTIHWGLVEKYCVLTGNVDVDYMIAEALSNLQQMVYKGISNDITKFCMPEAYKVTLQLTINARSLQNFLALRSDKSALWEIRLLARGLFDALPKEHKYLFTHCMKDADDQ